MPSSPADIAFDRAYVEALGLYGFVKLAWAQLKPGIPFVDGWHVREISNHLEAVSTPSDDGVPFCRNLVVNVPPGSTKSVTTSICWPAYVWGPGRMPEKKWMFMSFDPGLASGHGRECRELISSEWYQERWPLPLLDHADMLFRNARHGWRYANSVHGGGTGRHADIIVVDDPIKPGQAQGAAAVTRTELDFVRDWWSGTMSTRNADPKKTCRVVIMQRLHEDDLAGICLKTKAYTHLRLPMRYEVEHPCRTVFGGDPRTSNGELLCEARWSEKEVVDLESSLNVFAPAQLQQRPAAAGGMIFREAWFRYWDTLPEGIDEWGCSWDMTFKDARGSDYVCGQVWARKGPDFYLVERVYERLNFPNTLTAFLAQLRRYPQIGVKLIEDKANGPAVIATLERKVPGLVAVNPKGGKISRANGISYLHRSGNVYYPRSFESDNGETSHVKNMTGFPMARHDDSVDAETQMLTYWADQSNSLFDALEAMAKQRTQ